MPRFFVLPSLLAAVLPAAALDLRLPTDNEALFRNDGPGYFQFVDRNFEGVVSTPWQGGQFGFVRDARRVGEQIAFARFHEGLDVKPLRRDAAGNPLDEVRAILGGEVVHVADQAGLSNYGRYVVIRHDLPDEGPFYSLYAHLSEARTAVGDRVAAGQAIARMGFTGSGIDQRRAHVHVELNLLLNSRFEAWHAGRFATPNKHGLYNGMNLLGLDLQAYYLAHRQNPELTPAAFLKQSGEAWFELTVPAAARLEIVERYPWLRAPGADAAPARAWRVNCTRWGLPLAVAPAAEPVSQPVITRVRASPVPHYYNTRGLVSNSGKLTIEGLRFAQLLCGLEPATP